MQEGKQPITMPPKNINPSNSDPKPELTKPANDDPSDQTTTFDEKGLKKSKSEGVLTYQSDVRVAAFRVSSSSKEEGSIVTAPTKSEGTVEDSTSGRERLKRHRVEVAGRVWIPDMWGQEGLLKDWIDCTATDFSLANSSIMSARASLVEEGRIRANSTRLRLENSC
ncbi:hypothetical protein BUALT_Bualt11G0098900 [Buddleja alternifolia]|uniref:Uncharacterized protein n=1 Tax=Buddleja alternifolia TaxID=168488 RepID=A0AAV6X4Q0_9LAMI|nr:hypothetical protein BUALT_Bualt11G0098900 [Buddleja alternifolia]